MGTRDAERQLTTQQDRMKLCGFDSPRAGSLSVPSSCSNLETVQCPRSIEKVLCTRASEQQSLKVTLPFPGDFLVHIEFLSTHREKVGRAEMRRKALGLRSSSKDRGPGH